MKLTFDQALSAFQAAKGKVIAEISHLQDVNYPDDKGWLRIVFTDGTEIVAESRRSYAGCDCRGTYAKRMIFLDRLPERAWNTQDPMDYTTATELMSYEKATEVTEWREDDYQGN